MGKHKSMQCQHPGCTYNGRSDNMKRHMASHNKETLKYSPVISKAMSERLNLKMPRPHPSQRAPQPRRPPTPHP